MELHMDESDIQRVMKEAEVEREILVEKLRNLLEKIIQEKLSLKGSGYSYNTRDSQNWEASDGSEFKSNILSIILYYFDAPFDALEALIWDQEIFFEEWVISLEPLRGSYGSECSDQELFELHQMNGG